MTKYIIISEQPKLINTSDSYVVMTPQDFIRTPHNLVSLNKTHRVINVSKSYDYLSEGYYVSLLANARGAQCFPDIPHIISVNWRRNMTYAFPELNVLLEKHFLIGMEDPLVRRYTSFFGRHVDQNIEPLARRIFDLFRLPIVSFEIRYTNKKTWEIVRLDALPMHRILKAQLTQFNSDLAYFTGSAWKEKAKKKQERYWLGILHNPKEVNKPSNAGALKKFVSIGKKMGIYVELITKDDFSSLLEYDALFIRETTTILNHTYRFAQKAELEGIPCLDDTNSIAKCCNKVFLNELLGIHGIPKPYTVVLDKKNLLNKTHNNISFPCVLKIPDGSFSIGVYKINTSKELIATALPLFEKSDILLCQEFLPSAFDWRIGILNHQVLFANKYYMAKGHWQIYNHSAKKNNGRVGDHKSIPINEIPLEISKMALAAAKLIGDGLYGIDLKQTDDGRILVIEINDNPNIDQGVEDAFLKNRLYERLLEYFVMKIDA
jgi:glutathione synthase/RimK-type ligase-like ATP-grasp enzyme